MTAEGIIPTIMDNLSKEAEKLLSEIIRIPARSFNEKEKSDYIYDWMVSRGPDKVTRIVCKQLACPDRFDPQLQTLMLCSHIDTVEPAASYTIDPYAGIVCEDRIMGLGSNDDGGSVVSQIVTFMHLCKGFCQAGGRKPGLNVNLMLVLSAEEERSGKDGMAAVIRQLSEMPDRKMFPDFAIVGEPTRMKAAVAEKGLIVLDCVATGKSGHAARNEGINALYIAVDDINRIRSHKFRRKSKLMGDVKVTVTQASGGHLHNVIPDRFSFTVDIRPNDRYTNEEIVETLRKLTKSTLTPRSMHNRVSYTPENHRLLKAINKIGLETFESPTTSDWTRIPVPAVKIGPGDSSRSHQADEYILKSEIREGIEKYIELIKAL